MYTWNRNGLPDRDQACGCQGDEGGRRMDREFGIRGCNLVYIGWVNNKVILYSTRNCIQCPVINQKEKEYEMNTHTHIYMYNWITSKLSQHYKSTILQLKKEKRGPAYGRSIDRARSPESKPRPSPIGLALRQRSQWPSRRALTSPSQIQGSG